MNNAAQEHYSASGPKRPQRGPGPTLLPGIEGFYVLTATGTLGRYEADGRFAEEPSLSERLRDVIAALLRYYREGDLKDTALGLVTRRNPDRPWKCASLVLSDDALREIYRTGEDTNAPLTAFQQRNRIKSVYRGMELIMDTRKASQPEHPRYCPVLFSPEHDTDTLSRRYGVDTLDAVNALEVLDLMAPLNPEQQRHPELASMVVEMSQSQIDPALRSGPELKLVDGDKSLNDRPLGEVWAAEDARFHNPWDDAPEERESTFKDGDPVTYWLLGWFSPFSELNDLQRQFIARGHRVTRKAAGTTLIERGSTEDVTVFLVEGTLELEAFDGRKMSIVAGTRRAHLPVSQLRPHAFTVKAATVVTVIFMSQDMVREINRIATTYKSRPGIEVSEETSDSGDTPDGIPYEPDPGRS